VLVTDGLNSHPLPEYFPICVRFSRLLGQVHILYAKKTIVDSRIREFEFHGSVEAWLARLDADWSGEANGVPDRVRCASTTRFFIYDQTSNSVLDTDNKR
jgi:hypothetical protein